MLDSLENVCSDDHNLHISTSMLALIRLAWAVCLRRTNNVRSELRRRFYSENISLVNNGNDEASNILTDEDFGIGCDDEDEIQAANAIESGALEFARKHLLAIKCFDREVCYFCTE